MGGWHPWVAEDGGAECWHDVEAVFGGGGDVAADGHPVAGDLLRLESSGDLLDGLPRPQVAFRLVVGGRDACVVDESQHVVFAVAEYFQQAPAGVLLGLGTVD